MSYNINRLAAKKEGLRRPEVLNLWVATSRSGSQTLSERVAFLRGSMTVHKITGSRDARGVLKMGRSLQKKVGNLCHRRTTHRIMMQHDFRMLPQKVGLIFGGCPQRELHIPCAYTYTRTPKSLSVYLLATVAKKKSLQRKQWPLDTILPASVASAARSSPHQ